MKVWLIGAEELVRLKHMDPPPATWPIEDMKLPRQKQIAEEANLIARGEKGLKGPDIVARLVAAGITRGSVASTSQLRVAALSRMPGLRRGVHRYVSEKYKAAGRDFAAAFFFPEDLMVDPDDPTRTVPLLSVWDHPHAIKNHMCSSAKAVKRAGVGGGTGGGSGGGGCGGGGGGGGGGRGGGSGRGGGGGGSGGGGGDGNGDDDVQEVDLFGEDEVVGDAGDGELVDEAEEAQTVSSGSLALQVGQAAAAVVAQPGQTIMHKDILELKDPQHVPTAEDMFSHRAAAEYRRLGGHDRAAAWTSAVACEYDSYERRGFSPAERWKPRDLLDGMIVDLHESLRWDPEGVWVSPRSMLIDGYSRVLIESYLITHCSSRILEVMIGPDGCAFVYDRRQGSDLCESLFSRCVAVMNQDKVVASHAPAIVAAQP